MITNVQGCTKKWQVDGFVSLIVVINLYVLSQFNSNKVDWFV